LDRDTSVDAEDSSRALPAEQGMRSDPPGHLYPVVQVCRAQGLCEL